MTFQEEEASPSEHEREQKVRLRRAGRRSVPTTATAMVLAAASIAVFALAFVATGSSSRAKELATDGQSRIAGSVGLATSAPLPGRAYQACVLEVACPHLAVFTSDHDGCFATSRHPPGKRQLPAECGR